MQNDGAEGRAGACSGAPTGDAGAKAASKPPMRINPSAPVVWFGDLNYRIPLDFDTVMAGIDSGDLAPILKVPPSPPYDRPPCMYPILRHAHHFLRHFIRVVFVGAYWTRCWSILDHICDNSE